MKKVFLDGKEIYINDNLVSKNETGIAIPQVDDELENTIEVPIVSNSLEDTNVDLWGDING